MIVQARVAALDGLTIKQAAQRMSVPLEKLKRVATANGIEFLESPRRPSDWTIPDDPEGLRDYYAGKIRGLSGWGGGRRADS